MNETCQNCRHWFQLPADPNNLGLVRGECREGPPQMSSIQINNGANLLELTRYPKMAPNFQACNRFARREETNGTPLSFSAQQPRQGRDSRD